MVPIPGQPGQFRVSGRQREGNALRDGCGERYPGAQRRTCRLRLYRQGRRLRALCRRHNDRVRGALSAGLLRGAASRRRCNDRGGTPKVVRFLIFLTTAALRSRLAKLGSDPSSVREQRTHEAFLFSIIATSPFLRLFVTTRSAETIPTTGRRIELDLCASSPLMDDLLRCGMVCAGCLHSCADRHASRTRG